MNNKFILIFIVLIFTSSYCMAQLEFKQSLNDKEKKLYVEFENTSNKEIVMGQGKAMAGTKGSYFYITFLDKDDNPIGYKERAFKYDKIFLLKIDEKIKFEYDINEYTSKYSGISKIKIQYFINYAMIEPNIKVQHIYEEVIYNWSN